MLVLHHLRWYRLKTAITDDKGININIYACKYVDTHKHIYIYIPVCIKMQSDRTESAGHKAQAGLLTSYFVTWWIQFPHIPLSLFIIWEFRPENFYDSYSVLIVTDSFFFNKPIVSNRNMWCPSLEKSDSLKRNTKS